MVKKRIKQKQKLRPVHIGLFITLGILLLTGFYSWLNTFQNKHSNPSLPNREDILTIKGKVTMIQNSCGAKFLDPNEVKDPRLYAICDSGTGIRVEDKQGNKVYISTSVGGPGSPYHGHLSDINPGDIVTVYYVDDEEYGKSLYCSRCEIISE